MPCRRPGLCMYMPPPPPIDLTCAGGLCLSGDLIGGESHLGLGGSSVGFLLYVRVLLLPTVFLLGSVFNTNFPFLP